MPEVVISYFSVRTRASLFVFFLYFDYFDASMRVTALTRLLFAVGTLWPKRSLMLPLAIPLPTYFILYHVLQFCDLIVTNEDGTEHVWRTYYPALEYPYFMIDMTFYLYLSFSLHVLLVRAFQTKFYLQCYRYNR